MTTDKTDFDKLTDTGKYRALTAAELRAERWEQFIRHAKGAAKLLFVWLFSDDEWDEIHAYRIKRAGRMQ